MVKLLPLVLLVGVAALPFLTNTLSADAATVDNSVQTSADNFAANKRSVQAVRGADDVSDGTSDDDDDDLDIETDEEEEDELEGFPVQDVDDEALETLMELEDEIFFTEADIHVAKVEVLEEEASVNQISRRRKRWWPIFTGAASALARRGATAIFRKFTRDGVTRSGSRLTKHYSRPGNYGDAKRDFNSLSPSNRKSFSGGNGISGETGTVGRHRVTVRDGSSGPNSRPTLEVRSKNGDVVRKFRYDKD